QRAVYGSCRQAAARSGLVRRGLHAPAAGYGEVIIAELLLGQEMVTVDHLVVQLPGSALGRAVDIGALVADLVAAGVVPAGTGVRVGNRLADLVTCGADRDVGVGVAVRRLDHAEAALATATEP